MDFWYIGHKMAVYKKELVALIRDCSNWRVGEIAGIEEIRPEGARRFIIKLFFHDGHMHNEMLEMSEEKCISQYEIKRQNCLGIYYRYFDPINGNPAHRLMVESGNNIKKLIEDYECLSARFSHLSLELLDIQHRLIFKEPFPKEIG